MTLPTIPLFIIRFKTPKKIEGVIIEFDPFAEEGSEESHPFVWYKYVNPKDAQDDLNIILYPSEYGNEAGIVYAKNPRPELDVEYILFGSDTNSLKIYNIFLVKYKGRKRKNNYGYLTWDDLYITGGHLLIESTDTDYLFGLGDGIKNQAAGDLTFTLTNPQPISEIVIVNPEGPWYGVPYHIGYTDGTVESGYISMTNDLGYLIKPDVTKSVLMIGFDIPSGGEVGGLRFDSFLIVPYKVQDQLFKVFKSIAEDEIDVSLTSISPILLKETIKKGKVAYIREWDEWDVLALINDGKVKNDGLIVSWSYYDGKGLYDGKGIYDSMGEEIEEESEGGESPPPPM